MKNFNLRKIKTLKKIEPILVFFRLLRLPFLFFAFFLRLFRKKHTVLLSDGFLIGDSVLLRPLVKSLERNFEETLYLGGYHSKQIFQDTKVKFIFHKWAWASYDYSIKNFFRHIGVWLKIYFYQPKLVIESRGDIRSILFLYMTCPRKIAGYSFTGGRTFLNIEPSGMEEISHLENHNRMLAEVLHLDYDKNDILLKTTYSTKNKEIGISFSGSQKLKCLPCSVAEIVLDKLNGSGFQLTYLISPDDHFYDSFENKKLLSEKKINIWRGNFEMYFEKFQNLGGYIGMDSAGGHIASMFGIPALIIFGTQKSDYCKPVHKNNLFIVETRENLYCRPCEGTICTNSEYQKCLTGISRSDIEEKSVSFLRVVNEKKS